MKNLLITAVFMLFTITSFAQSEKKATAVQKGIKATIEFQIEGIESNFGSILVALHNNAEKYNKQEAFATCQLEIKDLKATGKFENIPLGNYAIAIFHDTNNNMKMDFGEYGIPLEAFGFSNNAVGSFGPASFNDAKFTLTKDGVSQKIKLTSIKL